MGERHLSCRGDHSIRTAKRSTASKVNRQNAVISAYPTRLLKRAIAVPVKEIGLVEVQLDTVAVKVYGDWNICVTPILEVISLFFLWAPRVPECWMGGFVGLIGGTGC